MSMHGIGYWLYRYAYGISSVGGAEGGGVQREKLGLDTSRNYNIRPSRWVGCCGKKLGVYINETVA